MPTRSRQDMAAAALQCWRAQEWPSKELIIVDDADDPSFPGGIDEAGIIYHLCDRRLTVGAKRNIACGLATGEVIICFDSDDWSAPGRVAWQVGLMKQHGKPVAACHSMYFNRLDNGAWYKYHGTPPLSLGTSLCFERSFWETHRFQNMQVGQDEAFGFQASIPGQLITVDAELMIIASCHKGNTSPRSLCEPYRPVPNYSGPDVFGSKKT